MECFDTMPQKFYIQLERVSRRRRRRRVVAATCWALTVILLAAFVLMGIDGSLGIADRLGRGLLTFVFVVLSVIIVRRWLQKVLGISASPLQIAHEIERQHPALRDVVANASEFLHQTDDDPVAGSESLRRAVVLQADSATDEIDWQQLTPRKPLRQAVLVLACVGISLGAFGWIFPETMTVGLTRLINPWSKIDWPREHDLQFVEPPRLLATGEDLRLKLIDSQAPLPKSITMHYRTHRQGRWHEEFQTMATETLPLEIRRPNVQESLEYRATGGDHYSMPWQSLEVVEPPRVEHLQMMVHPPAYTCLPEQPWSRSEVVYAGSELELQGSIDQTVTEVVLKSVHGKLIPAKVSFDGRSFRVEPSAWQIESGDTFTLQLTTAAGLTTNADKLPIEVVVDQPPQVRFVEPMTDIASVRSVAIPLVIEASDELAISKIELVYQRSDQSDEGEQRQLLWTPPNKNSVRQQRLEFLWELAPMLLKPGSLIEVDAQVTDSQPKTGQTRRTIRIQIVSEDELWHQILDRQARLVERLLDLLREQRELRDETFNKGETPLWPTARWASASHSALFRQQQIAEELAGSELSIVEQLEGLSQTIERNRLLRPEAVVRLQTAQQLLQNLANDPLAAAEQTLREITRQSQDLLEPNVLRPSIAALREKQDQVFAGLRSAIDLLMAGNVLGRIERELIAIETDQRTLSNHCRRDITPLLLESKNENQELQAALSNAARLQRELAHRFVELMLDMTQASIRLAEEEPMLAVRLAETITFAEELGTQTTLQSAGDQLSRRRLGRSGNLHQQILEDIAKIRARLTGQDTNVAAQRMKQLRATEHQLRRLRRQVAKQERELRKLSRIQRENMAEKSDKITKQLEQLQVPQAAKATRSAASRLRSSASNNKAIQQTRQLLEDAQRQLTAARRRQQVALARLEMAQLHAKLDSLIKRQQTIHQEILNQKLNKDRTEKPSSLSGLQKELREEVHAEANQLTTLPVFTHFLRMAAETMQSVENRLQQKEFDHPTPTLAKQALGQLTRLAKVLQQEQKKLTNTESRRNGAGERKGGDKPQEQTLQLALGQLELLKSLQADLLEKTQTLEEQQAAARTPTHLPAELARQQKQLTQLASQLILESSKQENEP